MSKYDQECAREFAALKKRVDKYFVDVTVGCPYNLPYPATFYQGLFGPLSDRMMELFLAAGYRRNGNSLYAMHCKNCAACEPIRLHPRRFKPNRNQKRIWRKNKDVDVSISPIRPTREKLDLCDNFLKKRYPYEGNTAEAYYSGFFLNKITSTFEIRYRVAGRLIGNGVVDIGINWLNAVYFFFDEKEAKRSPGIYNILTMINFCLNKNIEYLYLGYAIDQVSAMNYKKTFRPYFLYRNQRWLEGP
jgi:leucyl-tRNA---protein transferase